MDQQELDYEARHLRWLARGTASALRAGTDTQERALIFIGLTEPVVQSMSRLTELKKRQVISQCAPQLSNLKLALDINPPSAPAVAQARSTVLALELRFGDFNIWIKQPSRATYLSLIRAWKKGESDSEELFDWFRDHILRLPSSRLDPYLAQIVAGVHVAGGELLLAGDIHNGRKNQNLAAMSDEQIRAAILRRAWRLKFADENGSTDRIPVYAPGAKKNAGRTFDAMKHAVSMDAITGWDHYGNPVFLEEIGELFAPNLMETETLMHAAVIEALTRENFERVFRKVGLSRGHARFTARVVAGLAAWSDDPDAAEAIKKKQCAIVQAMVEDKMFGQLFLKRPRPPRGAVGHR